MRPREYLAHATVAAAALLVAGCLGMGRARVRAFDASPAQPPVREGYINARDGVRLFYRMVGPRARDTLVVIHGGPGFNMEYFAADLAPLAERHTLVFYDQRGSGRSTLVSDSVSLDARRFADDLEDLRRHFRMEKPAMMGHSWGAAVVALYAMRWPDRVGKVVLLGGLPLTRKGTTEAFARLNARRDSATNARMAELRAKWRANPGDAEACRAYYRVWFLPAFGDSATMARNKGDFCAGSPEALANKVRSVDRYVLASLGEWDWRHALRAVRSPMLVVHGAEEFMPPESAREWASAVPTGRLARVDGGHFAYVDAPESFYSVVEEFLSGRASP